MKVCRVLVLSAVICCALVSSVCGQSEKSSPDLVSTLKGIVASLLNDPKSSLTQRLLEAELSPTCMVGLLKLVRGLRNLDPWAFRLIDASAKYPTGLLQGSMADLGAFDECVETIVHDQFGHEKIRGQYCNLYIPATNSTELIMYMAPALAMSHPRLLEFAIGTRGAPVVPGIRFGICFISDCNQKDIQLVFNALIGGALEVDVRDCVTNEAVPWTTTQILLVAFMGMLALVICMSSAFDYYITWQQKKKGILAQALGSFSVQANLRMLLSVDHGKNSEAKIFGFLHGVRFFAIFSIVLGHTYNLFDPLAMARVINTLHYGDTLGINFVLLGYFSVDVFFFMSGFLMVYNIEEFVRKKINPFYIYIVAVIRRHIRTTALVLFTVMICYVVPLIASGPNLKPLMEKIHREFSSEWWKILLQVRNTGETTAVGVWGVLWYLSADFQLFMVAMPVLLILRRTYRGKVAAFISLGALSSAIASWQLYGTEYPPFMMPFISNYSVLVGLHNDIYVWPFIHGLHYFAGCLTFLLIKKYRHVKISKLKLLFMWCLGTLCCLTCLFIKYDWNRGRNPTEQWAKILVSIANNLSGSIFLGWLAFSCASGRGGLISRLLYWKPLVPLSRLSFGVYCIHDPFLFFYFAMTRERIFFSHFTLVVLTLGVFVFCFLWSLGSFLACEAPVGRLEKLCLMLRPEQHDDCKELKAHSANGTLQNGTKNGKAGCSTSFYNWRRPEAVISIDDMSRL